MESDLHKNEHRKVPEVILDLLPIPTLIDVAEGGHVQPLNQVAGHGLFDRVLTRQNSSSGTPKAVHDVEIHPNERLGRTSLRGVSANDHNLHTQIVFQHDLSLSAMTRDAHVGSDYYAEDIWHSYLSFPPLPEDDCVYSWSHFQSAEQWRKLSSGPEFLSEASPSAFDVALEQLHANAAAVHQPDHNIRTSILIKSLWHLGLGRTSILFPLTITGFFDSILPHGRVTGTSFESISEVVAQFLSLGNAVVALRRYADYAYEFPTVSAAEVSLARAIRSVLDAVEEYTIGQRFECQTVLALDLVFEASRNAVSTMKDLMKASLQTEVHLYIAKLHLPSEISDIGLLEAVFDFTLRHTDQNSLVIEICRGTLAKAAEPWLKAVGQDMGLHLIHDFTPRHNSTSADDFPGLPRFFTQADRALYRSIGQAMAYLSSDTTGHLDMALRCSSVAAPDPMWCFNWGDFETMEKRCKEYEQSLITAIGNKLNSTRLENSSYTSVDVAACSVNDLRSCLNSSPDDSFIKPISAIDESICDPSQRTRDAFKDRILANLENDPAFDSSFDAACMPIPLSLTPSLTVCSLFNTQYRILSHIALHSILHVHNLKGHILAHHSFSLFGSGLFASRLCSTLFPADVASSERHVGKYRVSHVRGLNLDSNRREHWPLAISELRLALMGILDDCWMAASQIYQVTPLCLTKNSTTASTRTIAETSIPGGLAFSIRTNSAGNISSILDSHSLHALDFLRLSGSPSVSIAHVMTPHSQNSYDQFFALLLRLLRVKFAITDQIPRDLRLLDRKMGEASSPSAETMKKDTMVILRRTQHAAHHFVSTISSHFMLSAIGRPMSAFEADIDKLSLIVCSPEPDTSRWLGETPPSIAALAVEHERTTDAVAAGLFLGHHQQQVGIALGKCMEDILLQSRCVRSLVGSLSNSKTQQALDGHLNHEPGTPNPIECYNTFMLDMKRFTNECQKLAAQAYTSADGKADDGARSAAEVLSRLDSEWTALVPNG